MKPLESSLNFIFGLFPLHAPEESAFCNASCVLRVPRSSTAMTIAIHAIEANRRMTPAMMTVIYPFFSPGIFSSQRDMLYRRKYDYDDVETLSAIPWYLRLGARPAILIPRLAMGPLRR